MRGTMVLLTTWALVVGLCGYVICRTQPKRAELALGGDAALIPCEEHEWTEESVSIPATEIDVPIRAKSVILPPDPERLALSSDEFDLLSEANVLTQTSVPSRNAVRVIIDEEEELAAYDKSKLREQIERERTPPSELVPDIATVGAPVEDVIIDPVPHLPASKVPTSRVAPCLWELHVTIADGRTSLDVCHDGESELTVICNRLTVDSPDGFITAIGKVEVTGSFLDGTCDTLKLSWRKSDVSMEGHVSLKIQKGEHEAEVVAERLTVQLRLPTVQAVEQASETTIQPATYEAVEEEPVP